MLEHKLKISGNKFLNLIYFVMEIVTSLPEILENELLTVSKVYKSNNSDDDNSKEQSILIIQSATASIGIMSNLTVIVVFLNHKRLRRKIPNIFIINQVRKFPLYISLVEELLILSHIVKKNSKYCYIQTSSFCLQGRGGSAYRGFTYRGSDSRGSASWGICLQGGLPTRGTASQGVYLQEPEDQKS